MFSPLIMKSLFSLDFHVIKYKRGQMIRHFMQAKGRVQKMMMKVQTFSFVSYMLKMTS